MTQRSFATLTLMLELLLAIQISVSTGQATEPPVPPGVSPGGVAVAMLGDGIDYTKPKIAARLARDGEGELIAWDFADKDARPYAPSAALNDDASALVEASSQIQLIIIKAQAGDPEAAGHMVAFAVKTPARIIFSPYAMQRQDWPIFKQAVHYFKNHLFITVQHGPEQPDLVVFPNLVIAPDSRPGQASIIIAQAAKLLAQQPALTAAALKISLQK